MAAMAVVFLLVATPAAAYVKMFEPYGAQLSNGSSVQLGKIGPGQTFYVNISSSTATSTGNNINIGWNELVVKRYPPGWTIENSSLNTKELSVLVKPSPNAPNGTYELTFEAINIGNYSGLGSVMFIGYVNVTPDVFSLNVTPTRFVVSPGVPAKIFIEINNTGVSDNPFDIYMTGLPAWNYSQSVIALHHTSGEFTYTIYEYTPGVYRTKLHVSSLSSPLVSKDINITVIEKTGLVNDYSAIGQGSISFPIIYEPAYALMYLISLAFRHS